MKVRLNLATSPLENNRRFIFGAGFVGVVAVALLVVLSTHSLRLWRANRAARSEASQLESEMRDFRRERRDLEAFFKQQDTREVMDRAAFLNGLIEQRSFPWTRVFMDLERLLPEGVRVVSLQPQMRDGRVEVRLVVGAPSDELKLEFVKTLDSAPEFNSIQVIGETRPTRGESTDRVLLELVAWYASAWE